MRGRRPSTTAMDWEEEEDLKATQIQICAASIGILFLPESTQGVDVGQVTALDYENEANRKEKWE